MEKTEFIHMRINPTLKKMAEKSAKKRFKNLTSWIEDAMLEKLDREKDSK